MSLQSESDSSEERDSVAPVDSQEQSITLPAIDRAEERVSVLELGVETVSQKSDTNISIDASDSKITIRFRPIGSTAPVNPHICKISSSQSLATVIKFLCKKLKLTHIYIYVSNSFQPNPDENLGELFNTFQVNKELVLNYCKSIAFG